MKNLIVPLLLLVSCGAAAPRASAETETQTERIGAVFVLVLGRGPTAGELESWQQKGRLSVSDLLAQLPQQVDAAGKRATAAKACRDAFGREPTAGEIDTWSAGNPTYTALLQQHLKRLGAHPQEYAQVITRAYQQVLHREAYVPELDYWRARTPVSYALLAGCIENWARRNAPGLMVTSGRATVSVDSAWLTTLRLSPAVAAEVSIATGLIPVGDANLAAATGRNVIAAGGGGLISNGGIHFVAAGRDTSRPVRRE